MLTVKPKRNGHVTAERPKLSANTPPDRALVPPSYGDPSEWREAFAPDAQQGPQSDGGGTYLVVPRSQIEPDPDQPRKDFDHDELVQLAESLKADGQLVPIICNVIHGDLGKPRYRIVEGERRWRAAGLARIETMAIIARDLDLTTVLRLQGIANLERADLNAIEQAEWCRRMTSPVAAPAGQPGGGGMTQEQLARRLGVTQAEISNRIRVLRVPKWARELVICGKMSRKHALELLRYDVPELLQKLEKPVLAWLKQDGELPIAERFRESLEREVTWKLTGPIAGSEYRRVGRDYRHVNYKIPAEEYERIKVINVGGEFRAVDTAAAKKLLAEAKAAAIAAANKKGDKAEAKDAKADQKLSPAEQKRKEADAKRQFDTRLSAWYHDWLRVLCARSVGNELCALHFDAAGWLQAWALIEQPLQSFAAMDLWNETLSAELGDGYQPRKNQQRETHELLAGLPAGACRKSLDQWARRLLVTGEGDPWGFGAVQGRASPPVPDRVVATLARLIGFDSAAAWRDDRSSPMRERYWELHNKQQLLALGKELGVFLGDALKKSDMVRVLLNQQKPLAMPKELQALVQTTKGTKKGRR